MSGSNGFQTPMISDGDHAPYTTSVPAFATPPVKETLTGPPRMDPSYLHGDTDPSLWGRLRRFSRAVDEAAGFDTTQGSSGTRPPPRVDYPLASAIGDVVNRAGGIVGDLAHGLSFGSSDRVDRLTDNASQQAQDRFRAQHPELSTTAQIVGSLPTAAIGEGALTKVIPPSLAPGLINRALDVGRGALRSGIVGGAAGAGMNQDDPLGGAAWGFGLGAGIPLATGAAGILGKPLVTGVATRLFPGLAEQEAAARIALAFQRDAITGPEARAALARLGPEGAVVDAGGANVTGLGETVASIPGPNKQIATQFLEGRMEGAPSRINQAINIATGSDANFHGSIDALQKARAGAAGPKYDAAFSRIVPTADEAARVQPYIADPIGQDALQKGLRKIEIESIGVKAFNPVDYGVTRGEDGKFVLNEGVPNLRLMDAVKRGYDQVVEENQNALGKLTDYGRVVDGARRRYVTALREMYPRYAGALDAWGGPSQSLQAMQLGRDALTEDAEITTKQIAGLSANDKDFFRIGLARALKDKADATQEGADITRRIFGNKLIRDRIMAGFDNPGAFAAFRDVMENEATFAKTRNEVLKGSQTARRMAGQQDLDVTTPVTMALTGHPLPAAANLLAQQARASPAMDTDPVKAAIARQLFGQQIDPYFAAMERAQQRTLTPFVRVPAAQTGAVEAAAPTDEQRRRRAGLLYQ